MNNLREKLIRIVAEGISREEAGLTDIDDFEENRRIYAEALVDYKILPLLKWRFGDLEVTNKAIEFLMSYEK